VPTEPAAAATAESIPTEAPAAAPQPTATAAPTRTGVTTEEVNFRAGPTQDTEIISIIPSGTEVKVYDTVVDNYVRVEIDGRKGWISADYLSIE
ncbi:MAG: SH3 domain-containing protein, partial [Chloroflexota bacterium]